MKIVVIGPGGKMGRLVVREALKRPGDFTVVGAVGNPVREYIGKDVSAAAGGPVIGAKIYAHLEEIIAHCDGVIDFSSVEGAMEARAACVKHGKPVLLGTTGFSPEQEKAIARAGERIALSESHNTSKAVNLIYQLLRTVSLSVGAVSDIDIIDLHDNQKLDAPSGTGKTMNGIITQALAEIGAEKQIAHHSVRSGNIPSSHTVIFGMEGERIELTHHSYDFSTFAKGALDAILYLKDQPPGLYSSEEVLGLK